jgi:hypothetical protein
MLAAGGGYTGDNTSTEGDLSMMILTEFGFRGCRTPFSRARTFALEHLISFHCASGDIRWALIGLAVRSFNAVRVCAQEQFDLSVRNVAGRAWRGARFAANVTDADTMVAAGGR